MKQYEIVCTLKFGDIFFEVLFWTFAIVVTFGLATPFFLYYFVRTILNATYIKEQVLALPVGAKPYEAKDITLSQHREGAGVGTGQFMG